MINMLQPISSAVPSSDSIKTIQVFRASAPVKREINVSNDSEKQSCTFTLNNKDNNNQ